MSEADYKPYYNYLVALENAGPAGFVPIGWLYSGLMETLVAAGLALTTYRGVYVISEKGKAELARLRAEKDRANE